jgi:outer membrane receptor protein involved in Fe transport
MSAPRLVPLAIAAGAFLWALSASAEEPEGDAGAASPEALEELSLVDLLSTEITTGTFLDFDLVRSPMSITVIERRDIIVSGARNLGELLEIYVPGFQLMVNKWNGDIWGLRGTASDRNTKIIFLINGLKLNTESRDGVFTETTLGLMDDIERVEVLRGPAGLAYGSGAIAGVVNVITRQPEETSGDVVLKYGSWDSASAEALATNHFDSNQSVTLSAGYGRSDGTEDGSTRIYGNGSFPTDYAPGEGAVSAPSPNGEPADGSAWRTAGNARGSIDYRWGNFRVYLRGTRRQQAAGGFYAFDPFPQYGTEIPDDATGVVDGDVIDNTDPRSRTESFGLNRRIYVVDAAHAVASYALPIDEDSLLLKGAVMGASNRTVFEPREKYLFSGQTQNGILESFGERRYFLELLYDLRRVPNLRSANGFQGRIDDFGDDFEGLNMSGGVARRKAISEVTYVDLALFSENEYELGPLRLHAGARVEYHTRTDFVVTPNAALVYTTSEDQALKLIYQTAANYGSVDNYEHNREHFDDDGNVETSPRLQTPSSPDSPRLPATDLATLHQLDPERIRSYELASSNRIYDFLLNTSISYNQVRDLFTWSQQLFRVVNAGAYDFVNFEADARYRKSIWDVGASWVYTRLINTDPDAGTQVEVPRTVVVDNGDGTYGLEVVEGDPEIREVNPVRDSVTTDGSRFLSLHTTTTKFFASAEPMDWLLLHANARIHWGLEGRKMYYEADDARGDDTLGVATKPIVKLNASVHAKLPYAFTLSLYGNNLLGTSRNRHSVRWQQMAEPAQRDLYTTDIRAFYGAVRKDF